MSKKIFFKTSLQASSRINPHHPSSHEPNLPTQSKQPPFQLRIEISTSPTKNSFHPSYVQKEKVKKHRLSAFAVSTCLRRYFTLIQRRFSLRRVFVRHERTSIATVRFPRTIWRSVSDGTGRCATLNDRWLAEIRSRESSVAINESDAIRSRG